MPQDGILAVGFFTEDVNDLRKTTWGLIEPNSKGAQLTVRFNGETRHIFVSRERGQQATFELLPEEAA